MTRKIILTLSILMLSSIQPSLSEDAKTVNENLRLVVSTQGADVQSLYRVRSGLEYLWQSFVRIP